MRYTEGFRNTDAAASIASGFQEYGPFLPEKGRPVRIMEVCGTHTTAIARYGIRDLLPRGVQLVSGPGCPVCVTDPGYIDAAVELAGSGRILCTFGDLVRVPGSRSTLADLRAQGATIHILYSPTEALALARKNPHREVVFLAVGFETTAAPFASLVDSAVRENVKNLSLLTAFKRIVPAILALLDDPGIQIDALLLPGHVSAVIGAAPYKPVVEHYGTCGVVAGFEPLDILYGLQEILRQLACGERSLVNHYRRVVRRQGNRRALELMQTYLEPADACWRGLGLIPESGLYLRAGFERFDACLRFGVELNGGCPDPGCRCGEVLKGAIRPSDCGLFNGRCTPLSPVGPCMVSSEGSCAAAHRYERDLE